MTIVYLLQVRLLKFFSVPYGKCKDTTLCAFRTDRNGCKNSISYTHKQIALSVSPDVCGLNPMIAGKSQCLSAHSMIADSVLRGILSSAGNWPSWLCGRAPCEFACHCAQRTDTKLRVILPASLRATTGVRIAPATTHGVLSCQKSMR